MAVITVKSDSMQREELEADLREEIAELDLSILEIWQKLDAAKLRVIAEEERLDRTYSKRPATVGEIKHVKMALVAAKQVVYATGAWHEHLRIKRDAVIRELKVSEHISDGGAQPLSEGWL